MTPPGPQRFTTWECGCLKQLRTEQQEWCVSLAREQQFEGVSVWT